MKPYYALVDGDILGKVRAKGDYVGQLSDVEAKYLVMVGQIGTSSPSRTDAAPVEPRDEPDPATIGRKTR